jgi:predicted nucleic acid-binding protein
MATVRPAAPLLVPTRGTIEERLQVIVQALGRKAEQTAEPVCSAVLLLAPNGTTYRLSVNDAGTLATAAVPR